MTFRDSWAELIQSAALALAGKYIGPQAVVDGVLTRLGDFSDNWSVVPTRFVADGDTVVADGKYIWNHKGTAKAAEVRMAHVWTLTDGKVSGFLQHVDTARVRELIA